MQLKINALPADVTDLLIKFYHEHCAPFAEEIFIESLGKTERQDIGLMMFNKDTSENRKSLTELIATEILDLESFHDFLNCHPRGFNVKELQEHAYDLLFDHYQDRIEEYLPYVAGVYRDLGELPTEKNCKRD